MRPTELEYYLQIRVGSAYLMIHQSEALELAKGKYRNAVLVLDYIAEGEQPRDNQGRFISIKPITPSLPIDKEEYGE